MTRPTAMSRLRNFTLLALALVAAGAQAQSQGQFDGPAPLAWRWQGYSKTLSGGSPLVVGDRILTALGSRIYALDRLSGNQIWRFPLTNPIEGNFRSTPILVNGVLVAASDDKNVYGVDPETGALKWVYQTPLPILGDPVPVGKSVFFQLQGNLLQGVNTEDGQALYSAPLLLKDRLAGQIAGYGNSLLYFSQNGELVAIDANTQRRLWNQKFTTLPPLTRPNVVGDSVYTYSGSYLVALNAGAGTPRFQKPLVEQSFSNPVVGPTGILVLGQTGNAYFYDLEGNLKTQTPIAIGSQAVVPGTAVGGKFLIPTANGALNLVDPTTGTVDWSFVVPPGSDEAATPSTNPGGLGGGPDGGLGGPGGAAGGPAGGRGGQGGITRTQTGPEKILSVQASAPAVFAGSTLLVPARDGSLLAFDRGIGVDLTPPDLQLVWPNRGEDVAGLPPLELIFKVDDEASGLKLPSLKLDIDGAEYETTYSKEGYLIAKISSSGKNKPLQNGRRTITVEASDWMGNVAKKSFTLNVDNTLRPLSRPTSSDTTNPGGGPGGRPGGGPGGFGGRGGGFGGGR